MQAILTALRRFFLRLFGRAPPGATPTASVAILPGDDDEAPVTIRTRTEDLAIDLVPEPPSPPPPPPAPKGDKSVPTELPNKMTPLGPDEAAKALSDGYKLVTGAAPNAKILGLLVAQTAFETGNWKSLHNYNFGNAKASGSDPYFQYFRCSEIVNGKEIFYDPPSPTCKFAAHPNAAEGAAHYIRVLKNRTHWWAGLQSGTTAGFVEGLTTAPAYFTANAGLYQRGLDSRLASFQDVVTKYGAAAAGAVVAVILILTGTAALAAYALEKGL